MGKNCKFCAKPIPPTRRSNSSYCTTDCYRQQKSKRDNQAYSKTASLSKKIKHNEHLLSLFYYVTPKFREIPFDYLNLMGFHWGVTTGETPHNDLILKNIGKYAYYLNKTSKTVEIWKLKGE